MRLRTGKTSFSPSSFPTGHSKVVSLLQFIFVLCVSGFIHVFFLFVCLFVFWSFLFLISPSFDASAVFHNCCISWLSSFIFFL